MNTTVPQVQNEPQQANFKTVDPNKGIHNEIGAAIDRPTDTTASLLQRTSLAAASGMPADVVDDAIRQLGSAGLLTGSADDIRAAVKNLSATILIQEFHEKKAVEGTDVATHHHHKGHMEQAVARQEAGAETGFSFMAAMRSDETVEHAPANGETQSPTMLDQFDNHIFDTLGNSGVYEDSSRALFGSGGDLEGVQAQEFKAAMTDVKRDLGNNPIVAAAALSAAAVLKDEMKGMSFHERAKKAAEIIKGDPELEKKLREAGTDLKKRDEAMRDLHDKIAPHDGPLTEKEAKKKDNDIKKMSRGLDHVTHVMHANEKGVPMEKLIDHARHPKHGHSRHHDAGHDGSPNAKKAADHDHVTQRKAERSNHATDHAEANGPSDMDGYTASKSNLNALKDENSRTNLAMDSTIAPAGNKPAADTKTAATNSPAAQMKSRLSASGGAPV